MVDMLTTLPTTGANAAQMMSAITNVIKSSTTSSVDPETGEIVPMSTLSLESVAKLTKMVSSIAQQLTDPAFMATLSEQDAMSLAEQLLEATSQLATAQTLAMKSPLASDKQKWLDYEVRTYETVLPNDPSECSR